MTTQSELVIRTLSIGSLHSRAAAMEQVRRSKCTLPCHQLHHRQPRCSASCSKQGARAFLRAGSDRSAYITSARSIARQGDRSVNGEAACAAQRLAAACATGAAQAAHLGTDHRQIGSNETGHSDVEGHRTLPCSADAAAGAVERHCHRKSLRRVSMASGIRALAVGCASGEATAIATYAGAEARTA